MNKESYTLWLKILFTFLQKVRKEGLMSIEADVECPEDSLILKCFELNIKENKIPLTFMSDVFRLMVGGNLCPEEIDEHVQVYIKNICEASSTFGRKDDRHLLSILWSVLKSAMQGYAPQICVEFGRFHIPLKYQPSFYELEDCMKKSKYEFADFRQKEVEECTLEQDLENFIESISK